MNNLAIILASGNSIRMSGIDKATMKISGKPMISYSLEAFLECDKFQKIIVTASNSNKNEIKNIVATYSSANVSVVSGGVRRQDSVKNALDIGSDVDLVAVHDGARPFLTDRIILEGLKLAAIHAAAVPVIPVRDTIKELTPESEVVRTLDRSRLYGSQTPQFFDFDILQRAHEVVHDDVTDDSAMLEKLGHNPKTFKGDVRNLKITVEEDIYIAEAYLELKNNYDRI